jgi:signal transduction histidine kinase/CheY-like chemotaxis protein
MPAPCDGGPPALLAGDIDALVCRDQAVGLYGHARLGLLIGWGVAAALVPVYGPRAGMLPTLAWLAAVVAWQAAAWWRLRRFEAARAAGLPDPAPWLRRHVVQALAAGLILGGSMWVFYQPAFGEVRFLVLTVLLGIAAGCVMVFGNHPPSLWAFLLALALAVDARLVATASSASTGLTGAVLFAFYVVMLLQFARRHCALVAGSIRMRHEQQALVQALRVQTLQAQRASQARTRFFAAASHDLRQPLHALGYYSELLSSPAHAAEAAGRIRQCTQALEDLFNGILGVARLDAGKVVPRCRAVPLAGLQQRLHAVHASRASQQGLQLRWRIAAGLVVHTDPVLLERIAGNLLANALGYTRCGGVLVAARRRGPCVSLVVADTGVGMDAAGLDHAFDEFVQLDNPQRDPSCGVGLGLPTVRRLCQLLGHRLIARSAPGRGSWFELLVPACDVGGAGRLGQNDRNDLCDRLSGRLLLVDDHEPTRRALQQMLQQWGLQCDAAADAPQAAVLCAAHAYDGLLCDFRLPGADDGLVLLQRLRQQQGQARVAAVLSGERETPVLPEGVLWLRKPVRPVRLRALLMAALAPAGALDASP